jgi:hypothetical protein
VAKISARGAVYVTLIKYLKIVLKIKL